MSFFCRGRGIAGSRLPTRNIQSEKQHPLIKKQDRETYIFFGRGRAEDCSDPRRRLVVGRVDVDVDVVDERTALE
mgnify:CR=1 FL=1